MEVVRGTHVELGAMVNVKAFSDGDLVADKLKTAAENAVFP